MPKLTDAGISWIICGQQTPVKAATTPKVEWIREIVEVADRVGIPVFLKNNLFELLPFEDSPFWLPVEDGGHYQLRQEFPL